MGDEKHLPGVSRGEPSEKEDASQTFPLLSRFRVCDNNDVKVTDTVPRDGCGRVIINGSLYSRDRQVVCGDGHDCSPPKGWREKKRDHERVRDSFFNGSCRGRGNAPL